MKRLLKISARLIIIFVFFFGSERSYLFASPPGKFPSPGITIKKRWNMPSRLKEISGISYFGNEHFACVQDELGIIFIYNTETKAIEKEIPFGTKGDYEGLAVVNESIWVVRSDGHLFEVKNIHDEKPSVVEYSTPLTVQQNIEGLCYDKKNNRLLLAIKEGEPGNPSYKGIYGFDLVTMKMNEAPVLKIDLQNEVFGTSGQNKNNTSKIFPSDIAIHPSTGDIYIIDGRKSKLLVINETGVIIKLYQLDIKEFAQPEGITFNPSGELFISNEARILPGNIVNVEISAE